MGPGTEPAALRVNVSAAASSAELVATKPPMTSECPLRYLLVEWTTASAPSSSGRWRYGVAKVLSTTQRAPRSRATAARAAMSTTARPGFVGDSTQTSRVRSVQAAATASRSPRSTGVKSARCTWLSRRWVPP